MGGAASIEIRHTHASFAHVTDSHFQELLSSKRARDHLFDDIAKYPIDGKTNITPLVSLEKLAAYFTDNANSLYPGFHVNVDTLNAAFKYTVRKYKERLSQKKNKPPSKSVKQKLQTEPKLSKAMVHSFLPTLLLFVRVWDIFDAADKLVVEDQRVFKGEFMRIKEKLNHVHGIAILGDTSDEAWEKEFEILDKNNDRFITFEEMCTYALDHIKKPFDYKPDEEEDLLENDFEEDDEEEGEAGAPAFVEVVAHSLTKPPEEKPAGAAEASVEGHSAAALTAASGDAPNLSEPQARSTSEEAAAEASEPVEEIAAPSDGAVMYV
jgi:Ca2+-binding EF-hand superfamily protein